MDFGTEIFEYAASLFDVVGVTRFSDTEKLLILGLESNSNRNLDDFGHKNGKFYMYGFKKYVKPKIDSLITFIHSMNFLADPVGRYGYPLFGEINLKEIAISAGLGKRGKSTVVLHPRYGPRLRFIAIKTNAPIKQTKKPVLVKQKSPFCKHCSLCIDNCPVKVLEPYRMLDTSICLSNITRLTNEGRSILCDICVNICPAGKEV